MYDDSTLHWESCCRGRMSCPQIAVSSDFIYIKDDYGNEVKIGKEYADSLIEKVAESVRGANR